MTSSIPPAWELAERGIDLDALEHELDAPAPRRREPKQTGVTWFQPPRLRGISHQRRIEIEQCLARTGSVAAAMRTCEVSYETVHTLLEWMAA